jgi:hypothetical protein
MPGILSSRLFICSMLDITDVYLVRLSGHQRNTNGMANIHIKAVFWSFLANGEENIYL